MIIVILVVALVILAIMLRRSRKEKAQIRGLKEVGKEEFIHRSDTKSPDGTISVENMAFSTGKIIPGNSVVKYDEILGEGQYGIVYKGSYSGQLVAIKMTKKTADVDYFKAFLKELNVMDYIGDHENIINFHGAVVDKIQEGICLAVIEFCAGGNLIQHLRTNSQYYQPAGVFSGAAAEGSGKDDSPKLSEAILLQYCLQIANGMEYLVEKKVIHGDLAARNILVFAGNRVKITDFGLSRQLYHYAIYSKSKKAPLPWRWMAIETFRYMEFSTQSDVWSYGVTLWEIFTLGQVPYPGITFTVEFVTYLEQGNRLTKPEHAPQDIYNILLRCWDKAASERPTFADLKRFFQDYGKPNQNSNNFKAQRRN